MFYKKYKKSIIFVIKSLVTFILFFILLKNIDAKDTLKNILKIDANDILLAILAQILSTALASYRWYILMGKYGFIKKFWVYFKSYFIGQFFNQVLPSSIGGDVVKVINISSLGYKVKNVFYTVAIDRLFGLSSLLILSLIFSTIGNNIFPEWVTDAIKNSSFILLGVIFIIILIKNIKILSRMKLSRFIYEFSQKIGFILKKRVFFLYCMSLSIIVHILSISAILCLNLSINLGISTESFFIALPPIFFLMTMPISLAGWGIRETSMVALFTLVGASKEAVLSISIVYGVVVVIASLPGLFFWIFYNQKINSR